MTANPNRRRLLAAGAATAIAVAPAPAQSPAAKKVHYRNGKPKTTPLYSEVISHGNLVFVSGHGTNAVQGVKAQTIQVLKEIEECLKLAGSSMEKALKCNVYLASLDLYKEMNEAYLGKFGPEPPVRTTVAVAGIPLDGALVEIEVIAAR